MLVIEIGVMLVITMGVMNVVVEVGVMVIAQMNGIMVVVGDAVDDAGTNVDTTVALDHNPVTLVCC